MNPIVEMFLGSFEHDGVESIADARSKTVLMAELDTKWRWHCFE